MKWTIFINISSFLTLHSSPHTSCGFMVSCVSFRIFLPMYKHISLKHSDTHICGHVCAKEKNKIATIVHILKNLICVEDNFL